MADIDRKTLMSNVKSVVVKVGTRVLSDKNARLDVRREGDALSTGARAA